MSMSLSKCYYNVLFVYCIVLTKLSCQFCFQSRLHDYPTVRLEFKVESQARVGLDKE